MPSETNYAWNDGRNYVATSEEGEDDEAVLPLEARLASHGARSAWLER